MFDASSSVGSPVASRSLIMSSPPGFAFLRAISSRMNSWMRAKAAMASLNVTSRLSIVAVSSWNRCRSS